MSNITEDLRRYRELEPVFDQFLMREFCRMIGDRVDPDWPESNDPRIAELYQLEERLENLSIESDSLVIEDRELYQLLGRFRKSSVDSALNEWGRIVSDDLYENLLWEYHPRYFVQRMLKAPPLTTLIELPDDVIDLLAEARKAFWVTLEDKELWTNLCTRTKPIKSPEAAKDFAILAKPLVEHPVSK